MNQKISRLAAAAAITTSLFVSSVFAQDAAPIADAPKAETPTEAPVATTSASAAPVEAPVATTPESAAPAEAPVATATESTVPVESAPVVAAIEAEAPVAEAPKEKASKKKESSFKLTGNVQAQAIKSLYDNDADNTLDNSFLRANIGGKFTSESFEAVINLRIFSPAFGNTIEGKSYDKISADTYSALTANGLNRSVLYHDITATRITSGTNTGSILATHIKRTETINGQRFSFWNINAGAFATKALHCVKRPFRKDYSAIAFTDDSIGFRLIERYNSTIWYYNFVIASNFSKQDITILSNIISQPLNSNLTCIVIENN